jgi:hypothetical protein
MLQLISWVALVGTILPSILFLTGRGSPELTNWLMLLATIGWFVATPLWMGREQPE